MKKFFVLMLVCMFLCCSIMVSSVAAETDDVVIKPIPLESINLVVSPGYQCKGVSVSNVTYTAYTTGIPDGSKIDFYSGSPSSIYPTELLGSGEVKDGKAYLKVFQTPDRYYIGSAVWTKPIKIYPPRRVYSNIVSYKVSLSSKLIGLKADVDNTCKTNVTYSAKLYDLVTSNEISLDSLEIIGGKSIKVKFVTYEIPIGDTTSDVKALTESSKPLRVDYGEINNFTAKVGMYLPHGRYIVYAECPEITNNTATQVYTVPLYIIVPAI